MEFWIGLYGMQSPRSYRRATSWLYAETIRHARAAERLGFDGFGLTEHHFWYDGYCPSLLPALAAIARRTERIRLAACALLLPLHHPIRIAEQAAMVDRLSQGRLELVLGYGYRPEEYEGFGLEQKARGARFSEGVEILRRAFSGERFSFPGRWHSCHDLAVVPTPIQEPHPPLWLAGGTQVATAERAGRLGIGYFAPAVALPRSTVAGLVAAYRRAADEAGVPRERQRVAVATDVAIAESREEAQRIVAEDVLPVYAEQLVGFGFVRDADGKPVRELAPGHPIFQVLLESFIVGTPEDVAGGIEEFRDLGCDVFLPRIVEANLRSERIFEEMRLLAERVVPRFRGSNAGRPVGRKERLS